MVEFWDCLGSGSRAAIVVTGAITSIFVLGLPLAIWAGVWKGKDSHFDCVGMTLFSGIITIIGGGVLYAIYDIISCAICPECGL